jgi:hypothetical protein
MSREEEAGLAVFHTDNDYFDGKISDVEAHS